MSQTQEEIDAALAADAAKPLEVQVDGQMVKKDTLRDRLAFADRQANRAAAGGNGWVQTVRARFVPPASTGPGSTQ